MSSTPPPPYGGGDDQSQGSSDPYGSPSQQGGDQSYGSQQGGDQSYGSQQGGDQSYGSQQGGYSSTPAYGSGSYQPAPGYYGGGAPNDRDNNFGVIALVTGILGLIVCSPLGIVAIIYGRKAQAAQAAGTANNGTMGTVGFWLGVVALVLLVVGIVAFIAFLSLGVISSSDFSMGAGVAGG
jgi:hypothetical protein